LIVTNRRLKNYFAPDRRSATISGCASFVSPYGECTPDSSDSRRAVDHEPLAESPTTSQRKLRKPLNLTGVLYRTGRIHKLSARII
jgi:hypothetical protein